MASQITHIPYGKKVLELFLADRVVDEKNFFIGTLFPDIRYLGVIDRAKTHRPNPTINELRQIANDFEAGIYAHSLIDFEREQVLQKSGIYDLVGQSPLTTYAMKFIEDGLTYRLIDDWSLYTNYLRDVISDETQLVDITSVQKWHSLLINYFQKPGWDGVQKFAQELKGFNPDLIAGVKVEIDKINQNQTAIDIISQTYDHLFK